MNTVDHTGVKSPSKPRLGDELQVTSVTQDSVDLSWTVSEGQFDSFVVQYKDRDGQSQVVPVEGSHREVKVSGLDPGRRYKLLLYGLREGKRVGPLSVIAMTGKCKPLPSPLCPQSVRGLTICPPLAKQTDKSWKKSRKKALSNVTTLGREAKRSSVPLNPSLGS